METDSRKKRAYRCIQVNIFKQMTANLILAYFIVRPVESDESTKPFGSSKEDIEKKKERQNSPGLLMCLPDLVRQVY